MKKPKSLHYPGMGNQCPRCKKSMERRKHIGITPKMLRQPFYFKEWDVCRPCGVTKLYEEMKVYNSNERSKEYLAYLNIKKEEEQNQQHLFSI